MSKELDKLIEQVLSEKRFNYDKTSFPDLADDDFPSGHPAKSTIVKRLSGVKPETDQLTDDDIQHLIDTPALITTDLENVLVAITKMSNVSRTKTNKQDFKQLQRLARAALQAKKDAAKKIEPDPVDPDVMRPRTQTMTSPRVRTQGGEHGAYTDELTTVVQRLLGPAGTGQGEIKSRIVKISKMSETFFKAAQGDAEAIKQLKSQDTSVTLTQIILLDIFNYMAKEIDHGAGAYLFEHFLALICGGAVEGKSTTDQNKMGATDFIMSNGQKGSAKYYGKGQNLTQAARGFEKGTTTYVIALKKQGVEQIGKTSRGTSDPDRLIGVELYFFDVKRKSKLNPNDKGNTGLKINGENAILTSATKDDDNPTVNLTKYVQGSGEAVLYLAEVYTQTFREMVGKAIEQTTDTDKRKLKAALRLMQQMYDDLTNAEQKSKIYIAEEDAAKRIAAGEATLQSLDTSKQSFGEIINTLEYQETYDTKTNTINEATSLDQLIEAVMKGMLNETK